VDVLLKLAADAGVEVSAAEAALEEGAHAAAREALDRADDALAALRDRWPEMSAPERAVIGGAAAAVRARRDAAAARVPPARPLSEGVPELDPDQERDPGGP
jgi:flavin-binding protein dodecin